METPWDAGTKVCSNGPGHITKMAYQVCSNDVPSLTLTYLSSRSNLLSNALTWEISDKFIFFLNC